MNKELWRKGIEGMVPYVPGKPIEDVKREYRINEITRLASNENPLGPSPKAIKAMRQAVADGWLYPEPTGMALREKLGDLYGLDSEKFVIGNGADHLISMICGAFINEGDVVLYSAPTFGSYKGATLAMGGTPVEIPLNSDYVYNVDAILGAVTERTKIIFICNPNNPTGTILPAEKLKDFLDHVPSHVLTVLDEAYAE
ncbi:MAG TPA: histidinol-phosphate transaminase, partial [Bacillota bacterium]|nr:histidinol-phosphate transaminase [Bacillota bacterium]